MSFNSPASTARWVKEEQFPFEVWTDTHKTLAVALGAANGPSTWIPARVSVLLDAEARVVLEYPDVKIGAHPAEVLEDARKIFGR